jgi:hypothetical protein
VLLAADASPALGLFEPLTQAAANTITPVSPARADLNLANTPSFVTPC